MVDPADDGADCCTTTFISRTKTCESRDVTAGPSSYATGSEKRTLRLFLKPVGFLGLPRRLLVESASIAWPAPAPTRPVGSGYGSMDWSTGAAVSMAGVVQFGVKSQNLAEEGNTLFGDGRGDVCTPTLLDVPSVTLEPPSEGEVCVLG